MVQQTKESMEETEKSTVVVVNMTEQNETRHPADDRIQKIDLLYDYLRLRSQNNAVKYGLFV